MHASESIVAPLRIGALAPLSPPGWTGAGRHLLAGLRLATDELNAAGGVAGRPLELVVRDTAADPERGVAAVDELDGLRVTALVGEYHSVVARAVALRADELGLPYLCSSAVLDALTDHPTSWVARIAPAQSHAWRRFADVLLAAGHERVAIARDPGRYWSTGAQLLRDRLESGGTTVTELDLRTLSAYDVCQQLADTGADALLLLAGHPEPAIPLVRAVRADPRLTELVIGAPAGQPELAEWLAELGDHAAAIPFLSYLPNTLGPLGARVESALRERLGEPPSFVAFEGYDTMLVLAHVLHAAGTERDQIADAWPRVTVTGTRGPIRFSRAPGVPVWQWVWPPVQVVERDPSRPDRLRVRDPG